MVEPFQPDQTTAFDVAVIGGGPAGLRAAEVAANAGMRVGLFDAKPSVGRKFLVAGRGGLNLTNAEPFERFVARYQDEAHWLPLLAAFDADALRDWAAGLGVETFAASTGRVYPKALRAAPLLRRWVERLRGRGTEFFMRHRWTGLRLNPAGVAVEFGMPEGNRVVNARAAVLALGGASWPDTGSDGTWVKPVEDLGVSVAPLQPANCGWEVAWSPGTLAACEGKPLKNIAVADGREWVRGELLVTQYGIEGGAIYQVGRALRAMQDPALLVDFKPDSTPEHLLRKAGRTAGVPGPAVFRQLRVSDAVQAILRQFQPGAMESVPELLRCLKSCRIPLSKPRPIAEAISSAGGVRWEELEDTLMVKKLPGVFVAGEMIDWEGPTGGYLIQGCFASGTRAGACAAEWARSAAG